VNQTHVLIAAALVVGFLAGRAHAAKVNTTATARNDINVQGDWWSYAGSWN
jgi:outer membrane murein-binding lipoprotein Lpp